MENLRPGCEPVAAEGSLHLGNHRPFQTKMDVTPFAALGIAAPCIGNANTANEAHLAVHDQELAVSAVVKAEEFDRNEWIEPDELDAGFAHLLGIFVFQLPRAQP